MGKHRVILKASLCKHEKRKVTPPWVAEQDCLHQSLTVFLHLLPSNE